LHEPRFVIYSSRVKTEPCSKGIEKDIMGTGMKEICIRQGRPSDARALVQLLASQRMATDIDPVEFIVAEVNCRLLGAARDECECCGDFAQCRPMSMRWTLKHEGPSAAGEVD
jgi:hypothetical protein